MQFQNTENKVSFCAPSLRLNLNSLLLKIFNLRVCERVVYVFKNESCFCGAKVAIGAGNGGDFRWWV